MKIFIATDNSHKEQELSHYFKDIGLKTYHIAYSNIADLEKEKDNWLCVSEQTNLLAKHTGEKSTCDQFEEVIHTSSVILYSQQDGVYHQQEFKASVEGFIFPKLKTNRTDVYNWDDVFVSCRTMKSYQEMKDNNIKNSARDLAFSKMIEALPALFSFDEKINLNFNPVEINEVISFEPFIYQLFQDNKYYQIAYKNPVIESIVNHVLNEGLFIRRANDRKQKNYWLPGLNAGIPLTPKKDELHEMTFMFHDIMHFIFPDVLVTSNTPIAKHIYIISRMMSEAFTLVLADMLFVSLLKDGHVEYDYNKRKIYPLFEQIKFDITKENMPSIKQLLWANVCFALMGDEQPLKDLVKNDTLIENYKGKYQRFFQEDYRWTLQNFENISKKIAQNKKLLNTLNNTCGNIVPSTDNYCEMFSMDSSIKDQIKCVFDEMFEKLKKIINKNTHFDRKMAFSNAVKRYFAGQLNIFFKFETLYNDLFMQQILNYMKKDWITPEDLKEMQHLYNVYIDKLTQDNFISEYVGAGYKNICPMFEPFYVFYESKENETFSETFNNLFKRD